MSAAVLSDTTVLLLTYGHGDFVEDALTALVGQTRPPAELIVSDDCSPDHTWAVVERFAADYAGPVDLQLHRTPRRLGGPRNRLMAWRRASHRRIVFAHGDDRSLPQRLERLAEVWAQTGASSISSDAWHYWDGQRTDRNVTLRTGTGPIELAEMCETPFMPQLLGATLAVDRAVCERFPETMPPGDVAAGPGDLLLPFRGALLGGHWYIDEPLIDWRRHPGQATARYFDLGADNADAPREALEAFFVFGMLQRLRDVAHYRKGEHDPARAALARRLTLQGWLQRITTWAQARHRLERAGWTQTWS